MPSPLAITHLPTPLVCDIHELLPLEDVRNLRLTCRWVLDQVFKPFIKRFYQKLAITGSAQALQRNTFVLARPTFAAAVTFLHIDHPTGVPSQKQAPDAEVPVVSDIIVQLPGLQELSIRGLTDGLQLSEVTRALSVSGVHPTSLKLQACELTGADLQLLLDNHSATLRHVDLATIKLLGAERGSWPRLLSTILAMPNLKQCDLDGLKNDRCVYNLEGENDDGVDDVDVDDVATMLADLDPPNSMSVRSLWPFHFLPAADNPTASESSERQYKWFRGPESGLEHYFVQMSLARLRGRTAVTAGLALILKRHEPWAE
ncbi:hypothetical protein LTR36_004958 [Oleoguttula mirabilis]|uniref:F-box domain-containing protein n=1 Tax=Oleoguttula mirabilis TaxID=1507867 RepID=A0AAV9JV96_9PEZI|nr:hypothetical protein LTR36_004958 [Oleoguttula mirabilis]